MTVQIVTWAGVALLWLGGIGMLRMRNPFDRLQVAGVADIGGASLVLIALVFHRGFLTGGPVALFLLLFVLFTGPLATHAIAKAAFGRGERPEE